MPSMTGLHARQEPHPDPVADREGEIIAGICRISRITGFLGRAASSAFLLVDHDRFLIST